jgi:hypothetical protein
MSIEGHGTKVNVGFLQMVENQAIFIFFLVPFSCNKVFSSNSYFYKKDQGLKKWFFISDLVISPFGYWYCFKFKKVFLLKT